MLPQPVASFESAIEAHFDRDGNTLSAIGILFDKDGTLLDFEATFAPACALVVRELAGDDVEALLVRPGSGKAIKDAMLRLRMEPGLGCRLSRSARMRAEREREAADEVARGEEAAQRIRAQAHRTDRR